MIEGEAFKASPFLYPIRSYKYVVCIETELLGGG